jgi:Skp family chaperone for outer membrane proteins
LQGGVEIAERAQRAGGDQEGGDEARKIAKPAAAGAAAPAAPAAPAVTPQPPANPVIAVIEADRVLRQSVAAQGVNAKAQEYQKGMVDQVTKVRADIEGKQRDLEKQRGSLSQEALNAKIRDLERYAADQQAQAQLRDQALGQSFNTAIAKVREAIVTATRDVAGSFGSNYVLVSPAVMLYDPRADITEPVLAEVNKRLSKVDFPEPKVDPAAAARASAQAKAQIPEPPPGGGGAPAGGAPSGLVPGGAAGGGGLNLGLPQR